MSSRFRACDVARTSHYLVSKLSTGEFEMPTNPNQGNQGNQNQDPNKDKQNQGDK